MTSSKDVLKRYLNDPERCVRETCEIALAKIEWDHSAEGEKHWSTTAKTAEQYVHTSAPLLPRLIVRCIVSWQVLYLD